MSQIDDAIDILSRIDQSLLTWIVSTVGHTPDEIAAAKQVVNLRGQLSGNINDLIARKFTLSAQELQSEIDQLKVIRERAESVTAAIDQAKTVVAIVSAAIAIAVQIIAMA